MIKLLKLIQIQFKHGFNLKGMALYNLMINLNNQFNGKIIINIDNYISYD